MSEFVVIQTVLEVRMARIVFGSAFFRHWRPHWVIFLLLFLISIGCLAENDAPRNSLSALAKLQSGLTMDSLMSLANSAGWKYDTLTRLGQSIVMVSFERISVHGIREPFQLFVSFYDAVLSTFLVEDEPPLVKRSFGDYEVLVGSVESAFGAPTASKNRISPAIRPASSADTTYVTEWVASTKAAYRVEFDSQRGTLVFAGALIPRR